MCKKIDLTKIRLFAMDVDGTLTDGKIYMGEEGELFKALASNSYAFTKFFLLL